MRMEAVASADNLHNLHSLIAIFRRGLLAIKAGRAVYYEMCTCGSCTEIPQKLHGRNHCHAQWNRNIRRPNQLRDNFCRVPRTLQPCHPCKVQARGQVVLQLPRTEGVHNPSMMPVDEVQIESFRMNYLGLEKSIYTKKQLDGFVAFQDSQGTRRVYLAEREEGHTTKAFILQV